MAAQTLLEVINASPLSPEDKAHWKELLPQMSKEQKDELEGTLIRKTEITKSIESIEKALSVIDEAEREVDEDDALEQAESERDKLLSELDKMEKADPNLKTKAPPKPQVPQLDDPPTAQNAPQTPPQSPLASEQKTPGSDALVEEKKKTEARLSELRGQLAQLSHDVSGGHPPSYSNE